MGKIQIYNFIFFCFIGVTFAPSIKGIIREGKSDAILLTVVDRHSHLLSGHCETSQVMKKMHISVDRTRLLPWDKNQCTTHTVEPSV